MTVLAQSVQDEIGQPGVGLQVGVENIIKVIRRQRAYKSTISEANFSPNLKTGLLPAYQDCAFALNENPALFSSFFDF